MPEHDTNDAQTHLTIGQLARRVGMRTSALRYYEEQGLLQPAGRSASGYRLYHLDAEQDLRFIQRAQRLGFSLADIRIFLQGLRRGDLSEEAVVRVAEARYLALDPGARRVSVSAERPGKDTLTAEAKFTVEEGSVEADDVDVDMARLEALARVSGGRFYASPKAEDLAVDLKSSLVGLVEHQELSLSNTPLFFLLFVALTAVEWYLRRRRNLI